MDGSEHPEPGTMSRLSFETGFADQRDGLEDASRTRMFRSQLELRADHRTARDDYSKEKTTATAGGWP